MSSHNICIQREIRKIFTGYLFLSRAVIQAFLNFIFYIFRLIFHNNFLIFDFSKTCSATNL